MTLLNIENLHTRFHTDEGTVDAVNRIDFSIEMGEIVGIVGESGSGKSVFAESIMQILDDNGEIHSGDIQFRGESLLTKTESEMRSIRGGEIAMVYQNPMQCLNPILQVGEQIAESVRIHQDVNESFSLPADIKRKLIGTSKNSESWRQAIRMIETLGIPDAASRATDFPHQLSGGMCQRAMIAMALAGEPDLLILDEPTTALDVTIQAQILQELQELNEMFDMTILLITHDLAVVAETCTRVNVMYAGKIVEQARADELFENPQHPYTQGLIGSTPQKDADLDELKPIPGSVPNLLDPPTACLFAPRCPEAKEECRELDPDFREVGSGDHVAKCLRRGPEGDQI